MARRKSSRMSLVLRIPQSGASICGKLAQQMDGQRRTEFAMEMLVDVILAVLRSYPARLPTQSCGRELAQSFARARIGVWGVNCTAENSIERLTRTYQLWRNNKLLFAALDDLKDLAADGQRAEYRELALVIECWTRAWGGGAAAREERRRFVELTGQRPGKLQPAQHLNEALARVLESYGS